MRKSRRRSRKMDVLKVVMGLLLVVLIVLVTRETVFKHNSAPAAKVEGTASSTSGANGTATPAETKSPTLSKTTAEIYVSNTFDLKVQDSSAAATYTSSDEKVATVSADGVVKGVGEGSATITAVVGGASLNCDVTVKQSKLVALTFDDGPCKYTPEVLDVLEKYHAKATFFVVGQNINATTAEYITRGEALGCEYGNHSFSHPRHLPKLANAKIKEEIDKGNDAIEKVIGKKPTLLRIPEGGNAKNVNAIATQPQIMWSVDPEDWKPKNRNSDYITKYVLDHTKEGDVVLMHDIHETSVKAVEAIVKGLQEKGYELVTVDELAAAHNITLKGHKVYVPFYY